MTCWSLAMSSADDIHAMVGYEARLHKMGINQLVAEAERLGLAVPTLCYDTPQAAKRAVIAMIKEAQGIDDSVFNPPPKETAVFDITDPLAFQVAYKALEQAGKVDMEGGSSWRYEVAFAVMRHLGIEAPDSAQHPNWPTAEWLERVIWHVEEVGMNG